MTLRPTSPSTGSTSCHPMDPSRTTPAFRRVSHGLRPLRGAPWVAGHRRRPHHSRDCRACALPSERCGSVASERQAIRARSRGVLPCRSRACGSVPASSSTSIVVGRWHPPAPHRARAHRSETRRALHHPQRTEQRAPLVGSEREIIPLRAHRALHCRTPNEYPAATEQGAGLVKPNSRRVVTPYTRPSKLLILRA